MPRGRSSGQVAQRQDKKDTEQSQELQLRFVREHGVGSWYYRLRIGRMRTGVQSPSLAKCHACICMTLRAASTVAGVASLRWCMTFMPPPTSRCDDANALR